MGIIKYESSKLEKTFAHSSFEKEFTKLFGKSRTSLNKEREWLLKQLILLENNPDVHNDRENHIFEKLEGTKENIYKIKHKNSFNPRYIYYAFEDNTVILLTALKEKKKSDYRTPIDTATKRINEIKGEMQDD